MSRRVSMINKGVIKELNDTIVVLDVETTGFSKYKDRIVELGAIKLQNGRKIDELNILINPCMVIPDKVISVHGITNEMVKNKPDETFYVPDILKFLNGVSYIVAHNANFDIGFIEEMFKRNGYLFDCDYIDTLEASKSLIYGSDSYKLVDLAKFLNINVDVSHRALADVETTVMLLRHLAYRVMKLNL